MTELTCVNSTPVDSGLALDVGTPPTLVPPSPAMLAQLAQVHAFLLQLPQDELSTEHILHGGMYSRTVRLIPGQIMLGAVVRPATLLIVNGNCSVLVGDTRVELSGYNVIPGCAGRQQLFLTHGPVEITMIFPTSARTVAEAEAEMMDEPDQLTSRKDGNSNRVMNTCVERRKEELNQCREH